MNRDSAYKIIPYTNSKDHQRRTLNQKARNLKYKERGQYTTYEMRSAEHETAKNAENVRESVKRRDFAAEFLDKTGNPKKQGDFFELHEQTKQ